MEGNFEREINERAQQEKELKLALDDAEREKGNLHKRLEEEI